MECLIIYIYSQNIFLSAGIETFLEENSQLLKKYRMFKTH